MIGKWCVTIWLTQFIYIREGLDTIDQIIYIYLKKVCRPCTTHANFGPVESTTSMLNNITFAISFCEHTRMGSTMQATGSLALRNRDLNLRIYAGKYLKVYYVACSNWPRHKATTTLELKELQIHFWLDPLVCRSFFAIRSGHCMGLRLIVINSEAHNFVRIDDYLWAVNIFFFFGKDLIF